MGILVQELRIGNYIYYHGTNGPTHNVNKIDGTDISIMESKKEYLDLHAPIPLTEQWLKDFGFEQFGNYKIYNKGDFQIDKTAKEQKEEGYWFFINEYSVNIVYVHKLQNLYFTLTNEELTKK